MGGEKIKIWVRAICLQILCSVLWFSSLLTAVTWIPREGLSWGRITGKKPPDTPWGEVANSKHKGAPGCQRGEGIIAKEQDRAVEAPVVIKRQWKLPALKGKDWDPELYLPNRWDTKAKCCSFVCATLEFITFTFLEEEKKSMGYVVLHPYGKEIKVKGTGDRSGRSNGDG